MTAMHTVAEMQWGTLLNRTSGSERIREMCNQVFDNETLSRTSSPTHQWQGLQEGRNQGKIVTDRSLVVHLRTRQHEARNQAKTATGIPLVHQSSDKAMSDD